MTDDHEAAQAPVDEAESGGSPALQDPSLSGTFAAAKLTTRIPWYTVPAILLGVPGIIWILTLIAPEIFFDQFVWKYYWGPIKSDAHRMPLEHGGIVVGGTYNIVNTVTWAALLGVCLLGITQLMEGLKIRMNNTVIAGATLWVLSGAVWHVLQDTLLIGRPLEYFYITPPIYLMGGAMGVITLMIGVYMQRIAEATDLQRALQKLWLIMAATVLVYTLMWATAWDQFTVYASPIVVALIAVGNYGLARWWILRKQEVDPSDMLWLLAIGGIVLALVYVYLFTVDPWSGTNGRALPESTFIAPGLALIVTGLVYAVARWRDRVKTSVATKAYLLPINLAIIFSQMVDAFATSLGIDLRGYREKHILSGWVLESFESFATNIGWDFGATYPTFIAFASLKLAVALLVVWAIDVYSREDATKYPTAIGFVKFAIIMVGIGPGVRNFTRLSLGV